MSAEAARLVFDVDAFELRADDEPVNLEPQALDVLMYLLDHRGQLVTKEQLLDDVWGDRFVSESALATRIKQIRHALGDDGQAQRMIKTVHGRGYRFVGDLTVARGRPTPATPAPQLPPDRTPLIGRSQDVQTLSTLLREARLVTLLGIGGTGKTRLATAAARDFAAELTDGVYFVDLVPVADDEVFPAIARAAGLGLGAGDADRICGLLSSREALLVLDNCEHLLNPVAGAVDRLLGSGSRLRVLVTSREPLDLVDERRFVVEPLEVGDDGGDALRLLAATAERFGVQFLSAEEHAHAVRVCRLLDGLPLALELAGGQLRHLEIRELADRLDRRFELLIAPRRDRRHASLLGVLDDSWEALDDRGQRALGQLAVFPGRFSVDDAEGVLGEGAIGELSALVDRSLIHRADQGGYRLLESVRMLTFERRTPDEMLERRDRHADWCRSVIGGDVHRHYFDLVLAGWIRDHEDDLKAAERHLAASGRHQAAADLLASTGLSLHVDDGRRAAEALPRIDAYLALSESDELSCRLHATGALAAMGARSPELIAHHGRAATEVAKTAGDPILLGLSLVLASWSAVFERPETALELVEEAAALAVTVGDTDILDLAEAYRGWHLAMLRREDEARETAQQVVDRGRLDGYPGFSALTVLTSLTAVDEPEVAEQLITAWLDARPYPSMWGSELVRSCADAAAGRVARAASLLLEIDGRLERAGQSSLPDLIVPAALLAELTGDHDRAQRWIAGVRHSSRPTQSFQATVLYRRVRARIGPDAADGEIEPSSTIGDEVRTWLTTLTVG